MFETFINNSVDKKLDDSAKRQTAKELILAIHNSFEAGKIIREVGSLYQILFTLFHASSHAQAQYLKT